MAATTVNRVRSVVGATSLSDDDIALMIEDAQTMIASRWIDEIAEHDAENETNVSEQAERYLTAHLITMRDPEIDSDSVQDKSVSFNRPGSQVDEWLRNTAPGRSLYSLLSMLGIQANQPSRSLPTTYR